MDFKNIDKKYRPVPFWSWNEKLQVEESIRQTALMDEAGMGGYFMHARGGLQTEYMGEEWFENVGACIDECNKRGMHAWAYDENGWPSGFGGGKVNGKGEKYWQKYLRMMPANDEKKANIPAHRIICENERFCFYYDVNEFYVDTLDAFVIADFINEIYVPYYEKYGSTFDGFFTDEPQISRNGIPWSLTMQEQYKAAYGEDVCEILHLLFLEEDGFEVARVKFWRLITELFSKNFMKQIYDWCTDHDLELTGHLVLEESLLHQLTSNGACMPHYEYFHIPGMDWLGRNIAPCLTPVQVASVAAQVGRKQVLSETFACCGHNVGHDELKRNYEWMMVRGINLMCQHLEGYSNRGLRKRDYPPAMYIQQPWWSEYKVFNDAMSRVGMILAEGQIVVDTLVMHTQTSGWICFNRGTNTTPDGKHIDYYTNALVGTMTALEKKHIPFHLGDEILMERHGRVEGNKLIIGNMTYTKVIIPEHIMFMENTEKLLSEFKANGGIITTVEEIEANPIVDNENITYTFRDYGDFTVHYFVNSTNAEQKANITRGSYCIDMVSGEKTEFCGEYTFPVYGSLLVVDDGTPASAKKAEKELKPLDLGGKWTVADSTYNSMTIDKCTYWFDGKLEEENGYVLNVLARACDAERPVDLRAEFYADLEYVPEKLYVACETPEMFDIKVNGEVLDKTDCGFFRDSAFRMLDISKHAKLGKNVIELATNFKQSPETFENLRKARFFEGERNKLCYDMEFEAIYLVGDFGVRLDGAIEEAERNAFFFDGGFTVTAPSEEITLANIEQQGFTFFAGELTVSKKFTLEDGNYNLGITNKQGVNAIRVKVNGRAVDTRLWAPFDIDLSEYLVAGENTVELTLINNLRNLLGPLHHTSGEIYGVGPYSFYKDPCIWNGFRTGPYTDKYSFVKIGLI